MPLAAGPYQMLFSRKSPLFAKGLNFLDRVLYLSPCYIYVVSGIATPTFIAIPLGELCPPMWDSAGRLHTESHNLHACGAQGLHRSSAGADVQAAVAGCLD